jgi:outer membrane protein OmpA-like peptidoglycan-associated protein
MKKSFLILLLLYSSFLLAQGKLVETVYFEFDKFTLDNNQKQTIVHFIKKMDTTKVESIQIYGYCDDRGANDYNFELSKNRVITVQNILTENGFNKNKIAIIEGKGRVIVQKDRVENISETRSKNRRVDLFIVRKNSFGNGIYNSFQEEHKVGDRIYLENIHFAFGSSTLTEQSKKELDNIVLLLQQQKTLEFEIRGHVCCTPSYFQDAIDKDTRERKLSLNRAKNVYRYLMLKGINSLRMHYVGSGNKFPLGQGDALDRRVEFLILKI